MLSMLNLEWYSIFVGNEGAWHLIQSMILLQPEKNQDFQDYPNFSALFSSTTVNHTAFLQRKMTTRSDIRK